MDGKSIIQSDTSGWTAIHRCLINASQELANGATDLVEVSNRAIRLAHEAGHSSNPDDTKTRFTGKKREITKFQSKLYSVNNELDWHFPDEILAIGWLIECGGPAMGRGPCKKAEYQTDIRKYVGGTRRRYNNASYGHGGPGFPESREYSRSDCPHFE